MQWEKVGLMWKVDDMSKEFKCNIGYLECIVILRNSVRHVLTLDINIIVLRLQNDRRGVLRLSKIPVFP